MNVLLFTGYTIEFLRGLGSEAIAKLLANIDTVIDGPFNAAKKDDQLVRGSTNQRIIHLTPALEGADFSRRGTETILDLAGEQMVESGT
jgi:anaerobic ribonucleoside-triphosphate reductase activating protein